MKLLDRHVAKSFLGWLLLVTFCTLLIFAVVDFVGNIKMWLARGMEGAAEYYLNYLPHIAYLSIPIAVLIATTAAVGNMARHLEFTAMQGSGIAPLRILAPVFVLGLAVSGGLWWLSEKILPDADHRRLEIAQPGGAKKKNKRIRDRSQFAYVTHTGQTIYVEQYSGANKVARNVVILLQKEGELTERYDARRMEWKNNHWELFDGVLRRYPLNGLIETREFPRKDVGSVITMRPEDLIDERQTPDEMDSKRIRERISVLRRTGQDTKALETQLHFRFAGPWTTWITLLIGAALSHRYRRSGGLSRNFGIGLFVAFSYYVLIRVGLQMGEAGFLPPWQGAWLGNLVFGLVALLLLRRSFAL